MMTFVFFLIQDVMKSEERQKLAKERREEKAKYLGKYKQGVERGTSPLRSKRAPPSVGVTDVTAGCHYCIGSRLQMASTCCIGKIRVVWASEQDQQKPNLQFTKDKGAFIFFVYFEISSAKTIIAFFTIILIFTVCWPHLHYKF